MENLSPDAYHFRRHYAQRPTKLELHRLLALQPKKSKRSGFRPSHIRAALVRQQGGLCALCAHPFGDADLRPTLDHIIPVSRGGTQRRDNLQAAHYRCNLEKGNSLPGP